MYNALNADVMFQEMRDRTDRMLAGRGSEIQTRQTHRWWRRTAHVAR